MIMKEEFTVENLLDEFCRMLQRKEGSSIVNTYRSNANDGIRLVFADGRMLDIEGRCRLMLHDPESWTGCAAVTLGSDPSEWIGEKFATEVDLDEFQEDALAAMKDADASLTHEQIMERIDEKRRSRSN
jgi:hypothetical protein